MWGRIWSGTSSSRLLEAQTHLLGRFLPELGSAVRPVRTKLSSGEVINAVDIPGQGRSFGPGSTLVLCHGYGSGLGFFFPNLGTFSEHFGRVVAVDWLGMGGSSRPACGRAPRLRSGSLLGLSLCDSRFGPADAVAFFTESMDEFCDRNALDRFHLLGHSLGGYLSGSFAVRHPERVATLTLASPAGQGERVATLTLASPAGLVGPPSARPDPLGETTPDGRNLDPGGEAWEQPPAADVPWAMRLLDAAWSANITPQHLVRLAGRRGPELVRRAVRGRFRRQEWGEADIEAVSDYLFHITAARGSGEYALNSLLRPQMVREGGDGGAAVVRPRVFAHIPLIPEAMDGILHKARIPTLVLFGEQDWLYDPRARQAIATYSAAAAAPAGAQAGALPGAPAASFATVPQAGHHLYLDNQNAFHQLVLGFVAQSGR